MSDIREILFRGKRKDSGEWVYGFFWKDIWGDGESCYILYDGENYPVDPATRGQYTGLTDKNGVKIFEGDIVRTLETDIYGEQRCFPVVYVKGAFWLYDKYLLDNQGLDFLAPYCKEAFEVKGNVYDNPELLEEAHHE